MRKDTYYFLIHKKYLLKIDKSPSLPYASHLPSPSRGREKLPGRFADDYRFFEPS